MDDARSTDAESVRRRSTWQGAPQSGAAEHDRHEDDALADALAAEVASVTSSIPVQSQGQRVARYSADDLFAALMEDELVPTSDAVSRSFAERTDDASEDLEPDDPEPAYLEPTHLEPAQSELLETEPASISDDDFAQQPFLPSEPPRYEPDAEPWHDLALQPLSSFAPRTSFAPRQPQTPLALSAQAPGPLPGEESLFPSAPVSAFLPTQESPALPAEAEEAEGESRSAPANETAYLSAPPPLVEPPTLASRLSSSDRPSEAEVMPTGFNALLQAAPPPQPGSMAVPPPGSQLPRPPRLRSLDDDTLATVLNRTTASVGVAGALAELEEQMRLRDEDAREFETWERSLLAIGTDDALREIDTAKGAMGDRFTIPFVGDASAPEHADDSDEHATPTSEPTVAYSPVDDIPTHDDGLAEGAGGGETPAETLTTDSGPLDDRVEDSQAIDDTDWARIFDDGNFQPQETEWDSPQAGVPSSPGIPQPTTVVQDDSPVLAEEAVVRQPIFSVETNDGEPTLLEYRAGRAARMFWQWFAVNSSVVGIAAGAVVFGLGVSVRQALVAILVGVALSLLPLGLATLAGKWSGQPTMVVSRAAFGVVGNLLPAALAVLTRIFWGGALLWIVGAGAHSAIGVLRGEPAPGWVVFAAIGAALLIAMVVALFGYALLVRFALALGVASAVLLVGFVALLAPSVDVGAALLVDDGPWLQVVTGAVLVFSVVGLAWANAGAEVARYQRPGGSGAASIGAAMAGTAVPALLLLSFGVLLSSSNPEMGSRLRSDPVATLAALLPAWSTVPLAAAFLLGLLCAVVLTLYSGGFALQAAGVTAPRSAASLVVAVAAGLTAVSLAMATQDMASSLADAVTTLAVPVAAWVGIFACDLMIRNERFDGSALMRRRSIYGDVNWVNLGMLVVASAIGFGFTSASLAGFTWQGYLWPVVGVGAETPLFNSDVGVLIALGIGLATPLISGVSRIRKQERATV